MALPIIQSTQATPGAGTPGTGRNDLVLAEAVSLSDTEAANSGASYIWTFDDLPIGSSAAFTGPLTATPSFTPDVEGSYRIKCLVNGVDYTTEILAVPLPNTGSRIPSFNEELEYDESGNAKGWHEAQDQFMRAVDAGLGGAGVTNPLILKTGDGTASAPAGFASAVIAHGEANGGTADVQVAAGKSGFAQGDVTGAAAANAYIAAQEDGAFASGKAIAQGTANASILASGYGAQAHGSAVSQSNDAASVVASGSGAFAQGAASRAALLSSGQGSFAMGRVDTDAAITASGDGASATGWAYNGSIVATYRGAFARGHAFYGDILASSYGAFAGGEATDAGSTIVASGYGATALGSARTGGDILSQSRGSFAVGHANIGAINASAYGSIAGGFANGASGDIHAYSRGSIAHGFADGGVLQSGGEGSHTFGKASSAGHLQTSGGGPGAQGAFAGGFAYAGDIYAQADGAFAFGVASVSGSEISASGKGSFAQGYAKQTGTGVSEIKAQALGAFAIGNAQHGAKIIAGDYGAFAGGNAQGGSGAPGAESIIRTGPLAEGAFAFGCVGNEVDAAAVSTLEAMEHGSWVGGYVKAFDSSTAKIETLNHGAFAHGEVEGTDAYGPGLISAGYAGNGKGAHAFGRAKSGSIFARSHGSFVSGYAYDSGVLEVSAAGYGSAVFGFARGTGSSIKATGSGTFAGGEASSGGDIRATNRGAFAFGRTSGGSIYANGRGSIALGYCDPGDVISAGTYGSFACGYANGYDITSGGKGSATFGWATTEDIVASADNSFQFGEGTNAIADSLKVGTAGIRFRGTTGFATPANGDIGVDGSGNIQMHTNSVTTKVAGLNVVQAFTKQQHPTPLALTDAANIALVATDRNAYTLLSTGGVGATREIDNATGVAAGMNWTIAFTNDTGGRDLTLGANYSWGDETPPTFTAQGAGEITLLTFYALSPTKVVVTALTGH